MLGNHAAVAQSMVDVTFSTLDYPTMNLPRSLLVTSVIAVTALSAIPVSTARAQEPLSGDAVPGVCLLAQNAVFANAKVGQAATARLKQLAEQSDSRLASERKPLEADIKSFQEKESTLSEAQRKQQGAALQQRMQAFQKKADDFRQQIQLTRAKAIQRIGQEAQPIIASSYKAHHCGLLLNRDIVLEGNMSNDLTSDVVQGLDRKMTTITFNLEPLPPAGSK